VTHFHRACIIFPPATTHKNPLIHQLLGQEIKVSHFLACAIRCYPKKEHDIARTNGASAHAGGAQHNSPPCRLCVILIIYKQTGAKEKKRNFAVPWVSEQHFLMWISREIYDYDKFLMPLFLTHTHRSNPQKKLHFHPDNLLCVVPRQPCTITY
jgi:hypothetical protein